MTLCFVQVGGEASSVIYRHMKKHGRVAVCGAISNYNNPGGEKPKGNKLRILEDWRQMKN